ncbi:hypothetical protein PENTCL1PPCAC_25877, partial [Pristionchus entomophagus]
FDFYESSRSSTSADSIDLIFFTVFALPTLLLLIATVAFGSFLQFLVNALRAANADLDVKRSAVSEVTHAGSQFCLLWGLTLTVFHHAAGFRGNAVVRVSGTQTSFSDLVDGLHTGSRLLIAPSATKITTSELYALVGNRTTKPDIVQSDQQKMLQPQDQSLVTMIESNAVYVIPLLQRPCQISKVTVPRTWLGLDRFHGSTVQNYHMSREHTTRGSVEAVNQVLLRMFSQDLIQGLWTRRYLSTLRNTPAVDPGPAKPKEAFVQMSLARLQLLFYFTCPGWILSLIFFIIELRPIHNLVEKLVKFVH